MFQFSFLSFLIYDLQLLSKFTVIQKLSEFSSLVIGQKNFFSPFLNFDLPLLSKS